MLPVPFLQLLGTARWLVSLNIMNQGNKKTIERHPSRGLTLPPLISGPVSRGTSRVKKVSIHQLMPITGQNIKQKTLI